MELRGEPGREAERARASLVLASACGLVLSMALWWGAEHDAFSWKSLGDSAPLGPLLFGLIAAATSLAPWLPSRGRRTMALAASLAVGLVVASWLVAVAIVFGAAIVFVARTKWPLALKLGLALGLWVAAPMVKWAMPREQALSLASFFLYWLSLPFAAIYLVVERDRGQLAGVSAQDEMLYLLALPRFALPFVQPIGAAAFFSSYRERQTASRALAALGLGLWGLALQLSLQRFQYHLKPSREAFDLALHGPRLFENLLVIYAVNAGKIFCAVAVLRLLGFDLGSGFRWPLLSSSFSEGFRRWNYYYYEFVASMLYAPLVSRLRRAMPLWLAHVLGGYAAILLGVWSLNFILTPFAISSRPALAFRHIANWQLLATYAVLWSLALLPQIVLAPLRRLRSRRWWRPCARVIVISLVVLLLALAFVEQIYLL